MFFQIFDIFRQVLPFLLRRMKEDVLDDLPPKITQDYYCELSPLQEQLYEDFSKSQAHQTLQVGTLLIIPAKLIQNPEINFRIRSHPGQQHVRSKGTPIFSKLSDICRTFAIILS